MFMPMARLFMVSMAAILIIVRAIPVRIATSSQTMKPPVTSYSMAILKHIIKSEIIYEDALIDVIEGNAW